MLQDKILQLSYLISLSAVTDVATVNDDGCDETQELEAPIS